MKSFIPTTFYAVLNYVIALLLISTLWTFDTIHIGGAALFLPLLIGWLQLIMAIFADNKGGFLKVFPMTMHNVNDVIMGSFLMCSPWIYDFHSKLWVPQVLFGGALFIMGIFTQGSPLLNKDHKLQQGGLTSTDSL
ncbi:SPW repeat domain-containing protein [Mucilaginibacter sp. FT3.2]|uniref:SPW repeat domain-containing protein n=1 Tax=Mucilaginibacter sp. FT3.2 TaxID=2723090 RepID=UPI0016174A47|nr:hypothetical protein [Mucilaginibacter sp. FT3.2]MBB6232168.1 hypothetical protein [Mucilaginibacter sp. FT3.2]